MGGCHRKSAQSLKRDRWCGPNGNPVCQTVLAVLLLSRSRGLSPEILQNSLKLAALLSACSLCDAALPEREGHAGLFHGLNTLIEMLEGDHWGAVYVMWEIQLLRELGFRLELDKCAGGGDADTLVYVSPKSGRAVSKAQAAPYKEKLLELPNFLRPEGVREERSDEEDILTGLKMTAYFLEHWVFTHHTKGVPEPRLLFENRYNTVINRESHACVGRALNFIHDTVKLIIISC